MLRDPLQTIERLAQRSASAMLSRSGTRSPPLRAHLQALISGVGAPGSFLNEPLLEAAHSYVTADMRLEDLQGKLLRKDVVAALDVVVDGRVYRSAGIKLSWKRPVTEEGAQQIQSMGSAWRCRNCGIVGTSHATPSSCSSCGSGNLTTYRYLKPSGFSCDPWETPHDKVEEITYVPPKAPWVATQSGEWLQLGDALGRHRASREGMVFHHTLGAGGHGYAICLACGRAEPETGQEKDNPALPTEMIKHRQLRGKKGRHQCDGVDANARPFAIQRFRALGYEVKTDVFELQLEGVNSRELAMPIAAAMRDALARKLGIEDAEMAITATQIAGDDGTPRCSMMIFDRAPGGAGFAICAAPHIADLIADASRILDCPNKCEHGCAACIMCSDLDTRDLERKQAQTLLQKIATNLALPPEFAILGPDTRAETQPLADAIMRVMETRQTAELVLWMPKAPSEWDLGRWASLSAARRLAARGRKTRLIIAPSVLNGLNQAARVELYGLATKAGCQLDTGEPHPLPGGRGHYALAWIGDKTGGDLWVEIQRSESKMRTPMLIRGRWPSSPVGTPVPPDRLLLQPERTTLVQIGDDLNGPIGEFGARFWELLASKSEALAARIRSKTPLLSIEYSDRYLKAPLPVRLLREVLVHIPGASQAGSVRILTATDHLDDTTRNPVSFKHDWRVAGQRDTILSRLIDADFPGRFQLIAEDKRELQHGRTLRLTYENESVLIWLDQGFGFWTPANNLPFSFSASPATQEEQLRTAAFRIHTLGFHKTLIAIAAESRATPVDM